MVYQLEFPTSINLYLDFYIFFLLKSYKEYNILERFYEPPLYIKIKDQVEYEIEKILDSW